ncbi:hypothetical protein O181_028123 [Austropuccinia psidii MF-1]|uniref:Uncharacterized protein n=1 Tax=Austropuccinia psidii MF-1 TaxID=1389203 RepID=A0A9Q3H1I5_9BASI|nr:hypothetical protein [Austropuccinia psidii MF-1]
MSNNSSDPRALMILIHDTLAEQFHPQFPRSIHKLLLVMTIFCPMTALLYAICAMKQLRKTGFWLLRCDRDGYLCPNVYLIVPALSIGFCTITFVCLIQILINNEAHLPCTSIVLTFASLPILLAIAWTKVWGIVLAIPPSKLGLQTFNFNRAARPKYLSPKVLNIIAGLTYVVPTVYLTIVTVRLCQLVSKIYSIRSAYNSSFENVMQSSMDQDQIMIASLAAFQLIEPLPNLAEKVLVFIKAMAFGYFTVLTLFLSSTLISYFCILRALHHQIKFLKKAIERISRISLEVVVDSRQPKSLNTKKSKVFDEQYGNKSGGPSLMKSEINGIKIYQDETTLTTQNSELSSVGILRKRGSVHLSHVASCFKRLTHLKSWRKYLPHLHPGAEADHSLWRWVSNSPTKDRMQTTPKELMMRQSRALKKYAINTVWQGLFACLAIGSYVILDMFLVTNRFDVPAKVSLIDLTFITIVWCISAYHAGLGFLLSLISCIVTFTKVPYVEERLFEVEEDV